MRKLLALIGFVMIIAGTYCPLLRPFHLFNWDVYALNKPYGIVILIVAVAGLTATIAGSNKLAKSLAWISLLLIALLYLAAVMKVNTSFSFIPFKAISSGLAHLVKFKWGWIILYAGAVLSVLGRTGGKKKLFIRKLNSCDF